MNIFRPPTYLRPRLVNVVCERSLTESSRKVSQKTMGFCTWGNEVPSERGRICQNCRDWFAISRKLVQTFFVEFHFFYGNHVIFLFPFWPLIKVYFLFFLQMFCDVLFWRIMMMMGLPFCHIIHGFFRFHENWEIKKYKNTRNNLIESALVTTNYIQMEL